MIKPMLIFMHLLIQRLPQSDMYSIKTKERKDFIYESHKR